MAQEHIDELLEWMEKIQGLEHPRKWALCLLREVRLLLKSDGPP
jgi:hypothetical protein